MAVISKEMQVAQKLVIAKAALYTLCTQYVTKSEFNMSSHDSIEKCLDDALAILHDKHNYRRYPSPCSEILIGGSRGEYNPFS